MSTQTPAPKVRLYTNGLATVETPSVKVEVIPVDLETMRVTVRNQKTGFDQVVPIDASARATDPHYFLTVAREYHRKATA